MTQTVADHLLDRLTPAVDGLQVSGHCAPSLHAPVAASLARHDPPGGRRPMARPVNVGRIAPGHCSSSVHQQKEHHP